jgi:hypothetical protein
VRPVAIGASQNPFDIAALEHGQSRPIIVHRGGWCGTDGSLLLGNVLREIAGRNHPDARKERRALNDVGELTDVSRKVAALERIIDFRRRAWRSDGHTLGMERDKMVDEQRNVGPTFAQWWNAESYDCEPEKKVLTEAPIDDLLRQIAAGRRQYASVQFVATGRIFRLKQAQKSQLLQRCEFVHFVQKEGTSRRLLEKTSPCWHRVRFLPQPVSEQGSL